MDSNNDYDDDSDEIAIASIAEQIQRGELRTRQCRPDSTRGTSTDRLGIRNNEGGEEQCDDNSEQGDDGQGDNEDYLGSEKDAADTGSDDSEHGNNSRKRENQRKPRKRLQVNVPGLTARSKQRIIAPGTKVTAMGLMKMMGVSGSTMSGLGLKKIRKTPIATMDEKQKKKLLRVFRNLVVKAAHAFLPNEPGTLIAEAVGDIDYGPAET